MANIVIYGMGVTGKALYEYLCVGNNLWCFDDDVSKCNTAINDIPFDCIDMCIISPGINNRAPLVNELNARGIPIVSELQYCSSLCKGKTLSVTGTNGKTTICQMIDHILKHCHIDSWLLGNGGIPFCSQLANITALQWVVLESSSFQLERCEEFAPDISIISNITPDHLNYHNKFCQYTKAKCNNFVHQRVNQYAIFNHDDAVTRQLAQSSIAQTLYYSTYNSSTNCYVHDDQVFVNHHYKDVSVMGVLACYSQHNLSNALSALLATSVIGVSLSHAVEALDTYILSNHKMQLVCTANGIQYIDDSKATNVASTKCAVDSLSGDIALILGGSDKGDNICDIVDNLNGVVAIVAMGQQSDDIVDVCRSKGIACTKCYDMLNAVRCASDYVASGGTVLLSPACASFDKYSSYVERGIDYQYAVREVTKS